MVVKPEKAPKKVAPSAITQAVGVLLGYQKTWISDTSQVKIATKTRRCGLTYAEAADCALLASRIHGMDSWYVGYNKDMAKEFIRDCANWAAFYQLAASTVEEEVFIEGDEKKSVYAFTITFGSGFRITALSSNSANLRGKKGRVIIDEAAFHPDLPELLKAAMALTMWGGQVHIISTQNGADNPFNQLLEDTYAGKTGYSVHRITFDDAVGDGLYKRICLVNNQPWTPEAESAWIAKTRLYYGDAAAEELDCIPSMGGGKYLSIALIESCMSPDTPIVRIKRDDAFVHLPEQVRRADVEEWLDEVVLPLLEAIPRDARTYFGLDFARNVDLSVGVPLYQMDDLIRRIPFVVEMSNMPFDQQRQIINYIISRLPRFTGGALDAGGNGSEVAEATMQKFGATRIEQVKFSETWYLTHFPKLKRQFEDRTIAGIPLHADLRDDLRAIELVKGIPKIVARSKSEEDKKQKRHGDFAIALALAVYASFELNKGKVKVASRSGKQRKKKKHKNTMRGYLR